MSKETIQTPGPYSGVSRTETAFAAWHASLSTGTVKFSVIGILVLLASFGGVGVWAATAPLSGAALASGVVIATGQNKVVQHLEGGIIDDILVKEGEHVEMGQILVRLSRAAAESNLQRLKRQVNINSALQARYRAEQAGAEKITFPKALLDKMSDPEVADIIATQKSEIAARREELQSEISVFERRRDAYGEEIIGSEAQRASQIEQSALIKEEMEATKTLLDKGLVPKSKYLALQRKASELQGNQGQLTSRIARAKQTIAEIEQEIIQLKRQRRSTVLAELRDVQNKLHDAEQQLRAADEVIRRVEIRAPVKSVVVKMHHNTRGGVIAPGEAILELLPVQASLLIEARVRPEDIDVVSAGRPAKLRFTSLRQRVTPTLPGEVEYVSADRLTDPTTNTSYYAARVRINGELPEELGDVVITPGMPVEVYVQTRERTALQYFLGPITDTMSRSFLED